MTTSTTMPHQTDPAHVSPTNLTEFIPQATTKNLSTSSLDSNGSTVLIFIMLGIVTLFTTLTAVILLFIFYRKCRKKRRILRDSDCCGQKSQSASKTAKSINKLTKKGESKRKLISSESKGVDINLSADVSSKLCPLRFDNKSVKSCRSRLPMKQSLWFLDLEDRSISKSLPKNFGLRKKMKSPVFVAKTDEEENIFEWVIPTKRSKGGIIKK